MSKWHTPRPRLSRGDCQTFIYSNGNNLAISADAKSCYWQILLKKMAVDTEASVGFSRSRTDMCTSDFEARCTGMFDLVQPFLGGLRVESASARPCNLKSLLACLNSHASRLTIGCVFCPKVGNGNCLAGESAITSASEPTTTFEIFRQAIYALARGGMRKAAFPFHPRSMTKLRE